MITLTLIFYSLTCLFISGCYENHKDWKVYEDVSHFFRSIGVLAFGYLLLCPSVSWFTTLSGCGFISAIAAIICSVLGYLALMALTFYWAHKDPAWNLPEDQ